jgi:hypothetical protein
MRALLIAAAVAALPVHSTEGQKTYVHLAKPGAMDALERERPEHYRMAQEVIEAAQVETCETLPQLLKLRFGLENVGCSTAMILTSFPAKRHVTFSVDGIQYSLYAAMTRLAPSKTIPVPGK